MATEFPKWAIWLTYSLRPPMDTYPYPGQGLSLSQLAFALNEGLKQAVHSKSYVEKD